MNKHTPGPWFIYDGEPSGTLIAVGNFGAQICGSDFSCMGHSEANTQLIAAAPDLLEALEQMMVCFDDGVGQPWNAKQLDAARAAIARAKGERQ